LQDPPRRRARPAAGIRAADLHQRPRILYNSCGGNAIEIHASHVTISAWLGSTNPDIDAIRIFSGNDIVIEDCSQARRRYCRSCNASKRARLVGPT
jgi:hypothetical protein